MDYSTLRSNLTPQGFSADLQWLKFLPCCNDTKGCVQDSYHRAQAYSFDETMCYGKQCIYPQQPIHHVCSNEIVWTPMSPGEAENPN